MQVSINSKYSRSAGDSIKFNIDERNLNIAGIRPLVQVDYIDGTKSWIDWGYHNAGVVFTINNIRLSKNDYDILDGMKKDNDYTEYNFHYDDKTWPVYINDFQKTANEGTYIISSLTLTVNNDPTEMETA